MANPASNDQRMISEGFNERLRADPQARWPSDRGLGERDRRHLGETGGISPAVSASTKNQERPRGSRWPLRHIENKSVRTGSVGPSSG